MHMQMPGMGEAHGGNGHGHGHHGHHGHGKPPMIAMCMLAFHWLFYAAATTCFLGAVNRIAAAMQLRARVKVLTKVPEALTDDERAYLIEKVASSALRYW